MNRWLLKIVGFWLLVMLMSSRALAADTVYYYYTNTLHSAVVITDAQGNVIERTYYAPYGQVLNRSMRNGPGYTGHEEDPATGLVYMQQRYYDPQSGRFLSTDPVAATRGGGNFNRYWYVSDNPYRYTDPFGLYACGKKVSTSDCTKIQNFVNEIHKSLNGLDSSSSDYRSLERISAFLGTNNDNNGVTIETASLPPKTVGEPGGLKTIELDMKQIGGILAGGIKQLNPGISAKEADLVAGGTTVAHETQHLLDANQLIYDTGQEKFTPQGFPTTKIYETATERRAYGIEGAFGRGLRLNVGFSTPADIERGVQGSVDAWCNNNPACQ